jgi:hypothetical protein
MFDMDDIVTWLQTTYKGSAIDAAPRLHTSLTQGPTSAQAEDLDIRVEADGGIRQAPPTVKNPVLEPEPREENGELFGILFFAEALLNQLMDPDILATHDGNLFTLDQPSNHRGDEAPQLPTKELKWFYVQVG